MLNYANNVDISQLCFAVLKKITDMPKIFLILADFIFDVVNHSFQIHSPVFVRHRFLNPTDGAIFIAKSIGKTLCSPRAMNVL